MVQKMKTLQAQKKDMSRKQIITFALVVTYAIASRAMNSSLMANYECAFVGVFLEDVSHVGVGEQEISCLLHLANSYPHKLWACCMLVMVETYLSKSNVE